MRATTLFLLIVFGAGPSAFGQNGIVNNFAQPIATTVQLPTFGVSFDADGVLELKTFTDPTGQLRRRAARCGRRSAGRRLGKGHENRKLSLVRIGAALRHHLVESGEPVSDEMFHLAGLTRIEFAFCYPEENEIVLAGPAEPWVEDFGGVARGLRTGKPILRLDDMIVALRAYSTDIDRPFVGCTISPREEGLARFKRFQQQIPKSVRVNQRDALMRQVAAGSVDALGAATVSVFGISPRTHFARVMIEADYRMKRMAIGVERPPVAIKTYADAVRSASHGTLERWWLTPKYDGVITTRDALAIRLAGQGVGLQTEMKQVTEAGQIIDTGRKPNRAASVFAHSFTNQYRSLAETTSVYAQLRQLCDLLIVSAHLKHHHWYAKANWKAGVLLDESRFAVETYATPASATPVVNSFWKQNRMFVPVGGGVSIQANQAIDLAKTTDTNFKRPEPPKDPTRWWWD